MPAPTAMRATGPAPWWLGATPPARRAAVAALALATLAVYANSLTAPFVFDDFPGIVRNESLRTLWPPGWLNPPTNATGAVGRPLTNFTLALNYAAGGLAPFGYHLVNVLLHALAGGVLFGLAWRTFARPGAPAWLAVHAVPAAWVLALLWLVHPLQTESVTCVIQRNEVLGGLFYLLTLYGFVRSLDGPGAGRWRALSVAACFAGIFCKEIVATAPVAVLLYDRAFAAGTFAAALRKGARYYAALAASWAPLLLLVIYAGQRGGTVGFGLGIPWWHYALKQCEAVTLYLKLVCWPEPLVLDYGTDVVADPAQVAPQMALLAVLLAATGYALWRWPRAGFAAAAGWVILAPSSSVLPLTTQTMAEHRMYLPLAAVLALGVAASLRLAGPRAFAGWIAVAAGLAIVTVARNHDFRSVESIWLLTLEQRPHNLRAQKSLAHELTVQGRHAEALERWRLVAAGDDQDAEAPLQIGVALLAQNRAAEAVPQFEAALRLRPDYIEALSNLGLTLVQLGRVEAGLGRLATAVRLEPASADLRYNFGSALVRAQQPEAARTQFAEAVRLRPDDAEAWLGLGALQLELGQPGEAVTALETALRLRPELAQTPEGRSLALARVRAGLPPGG